MSTGTTDRARAQGPGQWARPVASASRQEATVERLRYQRMSSESRKLLSTEGESGRFEFKRNADAVSTDVLIVAANTVVLDRVPAGHITVLVGVDEEEDSITGLVTGKVVGVDNLERARGLVTARARSTLPVPVRATIIEENTATSRPFLRVHVAPTRAPHYTQDGKRVTRQGASTRAITDEELVDLHLEREAEAFERRFTDVARGLEESLLEVARFVSRNFDGLSRNLDRQLLQIDSMVNDLGSQISERLQRVDVLSATAADAAEEGMGIIETVEMNVNELPTRQEIEDAFRAVFDRMDETRDGALRRLIETRQQVWQLFSRWIAGESTQASDDVGRRLADFLSAVPDLADWDANLRELRGWLIHLPNPRPESAAAWRRVLDAVVEARTRPEGITDEGDFLRRRLEAFYREVRKRPPL